MNLPNKLTIFRIILIPVFMVLLMAGYNYMAMLIFAIASSTDALDGYIARKYNLVTNFGKIMDPLADKLLVTAAFVCFVELDVVPAWMVVVILAREFIITSLRTVAASEGIVIAAGTSGKIKTVLQMLAIILLFIRDDIDRVMGGFYIWQIVLWAAVIMTIVSGVEYIIQNRTIFKS